MKKRSRAQEAGSVLFPFQHADPAHGNTRSQKSVRLLERGCRSSVCAHARCAFEQAVRQALYRAAHSNAAGAAVPLRTSSMRRSSHVSDVLVRVQGRHTAKTSKSMCLLLEKEQRFICAKRFVRRAQGSFCVDCALLKGVLYAGYKII